MLVRFSCGCVGTKPVNDQVWCFISCDRAYEDNEIHIYIRESLVKKQFEPISAEEEHELITKISDLVHNGYKFQSIQRILGVASLNHS